MKAILSGGPADGREIDIAPTAQRIQVPVLENPFALWREYDDDLPLPMFSAAIYSRTDRRNENGAVIFRNASERS